MQKRKSSKFELTDYIADIDAINFALLMGNNKSIPEQFLEYFIVNFIGGKSMCHFRSKLFIFNSYGDNIVDFYNDCDIVNSGDIPTDIFRIALGSGGLDRKYFDAANTAFKKFVKSEYDNSR